MTIMRCKVNQSGFTLIETVVGVVVFMTLAYGIIIATALVRSDMKIYVTDKEKIYALEHAARLIENDFRYCQSYVIDPDGGALIVTIAEYKSGYLIHRNIRFYKSVFQGKNVLRRQVSTEGSDYYGHNICLYGLKSITVTKSADRNMLTITLKTDGGKVLCKKMRRLESAEAENEATVQ